MVTLGDLLGIYDRRGKQPFPVDLPKLMALGEQSGLLTHIATTESVSLCGQSPFVLTVGVSPGKCRFQSKVREE